MNINKKRSGKKVQSQYCDQMMAAAGEQRSKDIHQPNSDKHELEIGGKTDGGAGEEMKTMIEMSDEGGVKANKEDLAYIQNTLRNYPWYHGLVLKSHVADVLKWDLSFVVRRSGEGQGEEFFCLSVRINNRIYHYAFRNEDGGWTCPKLPLPDNEGKEPQKFAHIHLLLEDWSNRVDGVVPIPRKKLIIYHDDITMTKKLGEGAFGEVWKGTLKIDGILKDCAVKKIKGQVKRAETDAFFHEAKIMSKFDHECIVKYYGQCTLISPLMAVMELAAGGTIRGLLRSKKSTPIENLVHFTVCIARGMEHISSKRVIHRDLAARNCLIGDNLMVKISDFGLSVVGEEIKIKSLKQAPIRWLPPETLTKGIFNEKTDVWSYGVVIWEIFTGCAHHPLYPKNIKDAQVDIKEIDKPHKFPKGSGPPKEIMSTFESCIRSKPENRPTFRALLVELAKNVEKWKKGQQSKRKVSNNTATQKSDRKEKSGRKEKKASSTNVTQKTSKLTLETNTKSISLTLGQSKDKISLRASKSKDKISKRASKRVPKTPSK